MVSDELKKIVDNIKKSDGMIFLEPASEEQIDGFEKEHGIKLPLKYREWLQITDGGDFYLPAGVQFYGVAHKPFIKFDDNYRPDEKYIIIGSLSSGDPILCEKEGENISIYNIEGGRIEDDEVYDDLYAFLNDLPNILGIGG